MRISTRAVVGTAVAVVIALLGVLVTYSIWALRRGVDPRLIALDITILAAGLAGLTILIGIQVRDMTMNRVEEATAALNALTQGHFEHRVPVDGPREVQELLAAVNTVAQSSERRQRITLQESSSAAMAEVLLGISHEMRNPLASMRISSAVLREFGDDEMAAAARRIVHGMERLDEVVSTLEEVGRATPRERVDPNRIARGALMAVQGRMLHLLPPQVDLGSRQMVRCNPAHVMQALTAILANAIEASPARGFLSVATRDHGDEVVIEIVDDGPGIDPSLGNSVFDPFVTTKAGHPGLGLTLARQVLEDQGATLQLQSKGGVRATVRLPVS